ncbi:MAG: type III pantothenate kinase [Lishizhenia sp.]
MSNKKINYCIDAGNTQVKVACFEGDTLFSVEKFTFEELLLNQQIILKINKADAIILSSVLSEVKTNQLISLFPNVLLLTPDLIPHIENNYETPNTLGLDRLCNAAFAVENNKGSGVLVVDIGTCIKFDFVNKQNQYEGGSISPGVHLRYKAMNDYTGKLPLINKTEKISLVGSNTEQCLQSGVINGIASEITQMINKYTLEYEGLTTFMTGGDAHLFDIPLKNSIFVHENLTLEGLFIILKKYAG